MANKGDSIGLADGFVRLALMAPFHTYLDQRGIDVTPIIRDFGLYPKAVRDPGAFVHAEVVYGLTNAYARAANDPYLGVHVGEAMDFASWPPFFEAARSARTIFEFLSLLIEGIPNEANSAVHSLIVTSEHATYRVAHPFVSQNSPAHSHGFGVGFTLRLFESIGATEEEFNRLEVLLAEPSAVPPGYKSARLTALPGNTLEFRFPAPWLRRNINLHSRLAARPKTMRDPDVGEVSVIMAFRSAALPLLADLSTGLPEVAEALGLEPKRLSKALARQGTTASKEIKRLRRDEAKAALADPAQPIGKIARGLGYDDPAHFSRFFKSQTGQSPRQYRRGADTV